MFWKVSKYIPNIPNYIVQYKYTHTSLNRTLTNDISYISGGNLQSLKNKNVVYFFNKVLSHFRMTADETVE